MEFLKLFEYYYYIFFFNTIFVSSHMYPENPEGTQVIVGSMNMGYISDTARNRTHNLFRPKREPIPLGHSPGLNIQSSMFLYIFLSDCFNVQRMYWPVWDCETFPCKWVTSSVLRDKKEMRRMSDVWLIYRMHKIHVHFRSHQTHYEQWGELHGTVLAEGYPEKILYLRGYRDHSYGT